MWNLCRVLLQAGWRISGSDLSPGRRVLHAAEELGIPIASGHAANYVPEDCDLLIYSAAIPETNPERCRARERGVRELAYVEVLASLMQHRLAVSIAGTHGKSSTTLMLASILESAGLQPWTLVGAETRQVATFPRERSGSPSVRSGLLTGQSICLVESCEFREHFLQLTPDVICLTSLEADHFDCYPTLAAAESAYARFLQRIRSTHPGLPTQLVYNARDERVTRLARTSGLSLSAYQIAPPADVQVDWSAADISSAGQSFSLVRRGKVLGKVNWQEYGLHQVENGLAAAATAATLGISPTAILHGLSQFPGVRRRLEQCSSPRWPDRIMIDDYAHHPTAIAAALSAIRARWGGPHKKLYCVFQPHQLNRTRALMMEFAESLRLADKVCLLPVYGARETPTPEFVAASAELTLRIQRLGGDAEFCPDRDQLTRCLQAVPPGDVIITLGAGDIDRIHYEHSGSVS
jgi:UDP-N-acetylmuramate--alanine ligase